METINAVELHDESVFPDGPVLSTILGDAYMAYCELIQLFDQNEMTHEWRYYHDGKTWLCKVQKKKRTIVWMSAWKGFMQATLYIPEKYLEEVYKLELSEARKDNIRQARNMGKSKACIFEIRESEVLTEFNRLMQYKIQIK